MRGTLCALLLAALAAGPLPAAAQAPGSPGAASTADAAARPPAPARPKIAVLVLQVGDAEAELADNLTEVLIAEFAKKGTFEIVGKEEFRARLGVIGEHGASSCLEQPACLGRVGTALGVTKIAAGTIGRRGRDHAFNLNLIDIATAKVERRVFKLVAGGVTGLIETLQTAARQLLQPRVEPGAVKVATGGGGGARVYVDDAFVGTTPVRAANLEPGPHRLRVEHPGRRTWQRQVEIPAGATLDMELSLSQLPPRRQWPAYVAWSALGAAVVTSATGTFFAVLSQESPSGATRADTLADLDRKSNQAKTATILFGTAGALALTSAAVFIFYWGDIFGDADNPSRTARRHTPGHLVATPLPGGAAVSGTVSF